MTTYNKYNNNDLNYEEQVNYEDIYSMMGSMMTQAFSGNWKKRDKKKTASQEKHPCNTPQ